MTLLYNTNSLLGLPPPSRHVLVYYPLYCTSSHCHLNLAWAPQPSSTHAALFGQQEGKASLLPYCLAVERGFFAGVSLVLCHCCSSTSVVVFQTGSLVGWRSPLLQSSPSPPLKVYINTLCVFFALISHGERGIMGVCGHYTVIGSPLTGGVVQICPWPPASREGFSTVPQPTLGQLFSGVASCFILKQNPQKGMIF